MTLYTTLVWELILKMWQMKVGNVKNSHGVFYLFFFSRRRPGQIRAVGEGTRCNSITWLTPSRSRSSSLKTADAFSVQVASSPQGHTTDRQTHTHTLTWWHATNLHQYLPIPEKIRPKDLNDHSPLRLFFINEPPHDRPRYVCFQSCSSSFFHIQPGKHNSQW